MGFSVRLMAGGRRNLYELVPDQVRKLLRLRPGRVHIDFACTEVHVSDYVEAAQEAKKLIDKFKQEKNSCDEEKPKVGGGNS